MSDKYVSVELFALSYGSLVRAIVKETNNVEDANAKLAKIGTSIGNRIADDIVVHCENARFKSLRQAGEMLVDYAFKTYLGITATLQDVSENKLVIRLGDNTPVTRFVTIPPEYEGLVYLMPLLGAIKAVLAMLHYSVEVTMKSDRLVRKDAPNEIEIRLLEVMHDTLPPGEYLN
jgi:hypothetical protein